MKIGKYIVRWRPWGWSYATPVVYIKKKRKLWFGYKMVELWKGDAQPLERVEKMKPNRTIELFNDTIKQYEDYTKAWEDHYNAKTIQTTRTKQKRPITQRGICTLL